ncbi:MAG: hypothetical protein ACP5N2_06205 [Candidatus Nanoarchaeia archaeon]
MRKSMILRTVFAVLLVVIISVISFILPTDFSDYLSGRVVTQVYVTGFQTTNCSIHLKEGINMVSFFCADEASSVDQSMINVTNQSIDYYAVFYYNPNNINDSWSSYNPELPTWATQTINNLDRRKGYVVVMNNEGEFFNDGLRFVNTKIILQTGWNFVGYPSDVEKNISEAFSSIDGKYTRVEAYQVVNDSNQWRLYVPNSTGTLVVLEPMVGYWIFMNESAELIVNW